MYLPLISACFPENRPVFESRILAPRGYGHDHSYVWTALILVSCMHAAVFLALRPEPRPLPADMFPKPLMVSLVSAPHKPQAPAEPAAPPVKKRIKPVPVKRKRPDSHSIKPQALTAPAVPIEEPASVLNPAPERQAAKAADKQSEAVESFQQADFNAAYLQNPAPDYPPVSRRLGEQGKVMVRVRVTADGLAGAVDLEASSGSPRLDRAALAAVKKWRFVPAKRNGQPVSASVIIPVKFSIEG